MSFRRSKQAVLIALCFGLSVLVCFMLIRTATAGSDATPKDLFYQELKTPSADQGTSAAYCLELHRPGTPIVLCNNRFAFQSGDGIRLHLRTSKSAYAYIVLSGSSGRKAVIYPPEGSTDDNRLEGGKEYIIPPHGLIRFDDNAGTEQLFVVLANQPLNVEEQLSSAAATIDENSLNGLPQQIGRYSVMSNDGFYKLGDKAPGNGLVFVTNPDADKPMVVALKLRHTSAGEASPENTQSSAEAPRTQPIGFIPRYVLEEVAGHNPGARGLQSTLQYTATLERSFALPEADLPARVAGADSARQLYDAGGKFLEESEFPGTRARFEGEPPTHKFELDQAYEYTGVVRDFYKKVFGRDSIDNRGMKFIGTENFGINFENAFWTPKAKQMVYGSPGADSAWSTVVLLDVIAHEITHGITEYEAGYEYAGQAGALNEHISDVFGQVIRQWYEKKSAKDSDWLIGKGIWKPGINGKALRNMLNPGTAYDDVKIGKDYQPAHMKNYARLAVDNQHDWGGVHVNCGIPNRAFALFSIDVGGNAWDRPAHIWYAARAGSGTKPSFAQFAFATIQAAKKLGYDKDVSKLEKAWLAVGVTPSATAGDTLTPH